MFLSWNPLVPHSTQEQKKMSLYISSLVMIACAGILSSSKPKDDFLELRISTQLEKKTPFTISSDAQSIVEKIFEIKEKEWIQKEEKRDYNIRKISRIPLGDRWVFWMRIFRDLHLDAGMMLDIIQRESSWIPHLTSSKWAKWLMQVKDIVLDDMLGIEWIKKYGSFFLALNADTLEKMSYDEDKLKLASLKKTIRNILLASQSKDKDILKKLLEEYNQLVFSLKIELYNPDVNVILGSVLIKYLDKVSADNLESRSSKVTYIIENFNESDIDRINQFRRADKKKPLSYDYDFSDLDIKKIMTLSMYNVWPNAKDIKAGVLYAVAILA